MKPPPLTLMRAQEARLSRLLQDAEQAQKRNQANDATIDDMVEEQQILDDMMDVQAELNEFRRTHESELADALQRELIQKRREARTVTQPADMRTWHGLWDRKDTPTAEKVATLSIITLLLVGIGTTCWLVGSGVWHSGVYLFNLFR